jgi:putative transcriptional regulator
MIIYKDILQKLKDAGYNTNRIRKERILSEGTLQRLRDGRPITTETIDTICKLTGFNVCDLIEYKEGQE